MSEASENNATPTPSLSEWKTLSALGTQLEAELFQTNKATLFSALERAGVTRIVVTFDGYGDSGQIENVVAKAGDDDIVMPNAMIEFATTVWGQPEPERSFVTVTAAVESLAYDALERTHGGWENNDGAYGEFCFDASARCIHLEFNERFTSSELYTHDF